MKQKSRNLLLSSIVLVYLSGCATRLDLAKSGHVTVETYSPGKVKILWGHATDVDRHFVVSGQLKRLDRAAMPLRVHVHVLELSPDNTILQSLQCSGVYVPRRRVGKGPNWKRFEVRSVILPKTGSRIVIIVHNHNEPHSDQQLLSICS